MNIPIIQVKGFLKVFPDMLRLMATVIAMLDLGRWRLAEPRR